MEAGAKLFSTRASLAPSVPDLAVQAGRPFVDLVQVCLSELRADITRLFQSGWAEAERNRTCTLADTLDQACERHGYRRLALVTRSVAALAGLTRDVAIQFTKELRRKFKELLLLAEKCLLERGAYSGHLLPHPSQCSG